MPCLQIGDEMTSSGLNIDSLVEKELDFVLDHQGLQSLLHCDSSAKPFRRAVELLDAARSFLAPAFVIRRFELEKATEQGIEIGGIELTSRIVAQKAAAAKYVYAYLATCSMGIEQLIADTPKVSDKYLLDQLAYLAYLQAMEASVAAAESVFAVKRQVRLCPGSVIDWPVEETKKIFALLEDLVQQLAVSIDDNGLMRPLKTTVGIFYASDEEFESCSLCPRAVCPSRRGAFDPKLQEKMIKL